MCVCVQTRTYIHACKHYIHTYKYACIHALIIKTLHTYTHTYANAYITNINACTHTYMHTYI